MADDKTGIDYPTIEVPGRGVCIVKFDLYAAYIIDEKLGLSLDDFIQKLRDVMPKMGKDDAGNDIVIERGRVSVPFLMKALQACTWNQLQMTAEDLAKAFGEVSALPTIATAIITAVGNMQSSAKPAATPATIVQPPSTVN